MESQQTDPLANLNDKQRLFVESYCQNRNGAKAAREAGYAESGCRQEAYRLLTNADILAAISQLMEQSAMTAGEGLGRMTAWARGSLEYFLDENGELDLTTEEAKQNRGLLKKVRQRKTIRTTPAGDKVEETQVEIEIHDPVAAVDKMLHIHGRYTNKIDINSLSDEQVNQLLDKVLKRI